MHINLRELEHMSQLRAQGTMAPRAAVAAMFAFGRPDEVVTWTHAHDGSGRRWTMLARTDGALVVVEASCPTDDWTWHTTTDPEGAEVRSSRFDVSRIVRIEATDVAVRHDEAVEAAGVMWENGWALHLDGYPHPVLVPASAAEGETERVRLFVLRLVTHPGSKDD